MANDVGGRTKARLPRRPIVSPEQPASACDDVRWLTTELEYVFAPGHSVRGVRHTETTGLTFEPRRVEMTSDAESVVRSWLSCYAARDRAAVLDHYADDAIWHVSWWRDPRVGRDAIRAELDGQFDGMSNRRSETRNFFAKDGVVFIEAIDSITLGDKEATLHWSTVLEVNGDGKIAEQRDYWDTRELEAQLT